jgi:uracil-DNA glycosylase family 4
MCEQLASDSVSRNYKRITTMPTGYGSYCNGCPYACGKHLAPHESAMRASPLSMEENGGRMLLVFQSPGIEEWSTGHPVSGRSRGSVGARLEAAFTDVGKSRRDFNITNSVKCFPGKRLVEDKKRPRDQAITAKARRHCADWLQLDMESAEYERIVVFGAVAKRTIQDLSLSTALPIRYLIHPSAGLLDAVLRKAIA